MFQMGISLHIGSLHVCRFAGMECLHRRNPDPGFGNVAFRGVDVFPVGCFSVGSVLFLFLSVSIVVVFNWCHRVQRIQISL